MKNFQNGNLNSSSSGDVSDTINDPRLTNVSYSSTPYDVKTDASTYLTFLNVNNSEYLGPYDIIDKTNLCNLLITSNYIGIREVDFFSTTLTDSYSGFNFFKHITSTTI